MTAHSTRQHAGYATQASRRGETYIACSTCGNRAHPRQQATPPETVGDAVRAFLTFALLIVSFYALALVAGAWVVAS